MDLALTGHLYSLFSCILILIWIMLAILGFTEILKTGVFNNKQKEHLNTIILSGKMLLGIVNDILDFSKVEAGKLKFEKINFNLYDY